MAFNDPTLEPLRPRAAPPLTSTLVVVFTGGRPVRQEHAIVTSVDVGRAARAVRIDDDRMSRAHAVLVATPAGVRLENLSQHGTFVNGVRVDGTTHVDDGSVLRFGDTFAVVRRVPTVVEDAPIDDIIGDSPHARTLRATLAVVAPSPAKVLLLGETGSGKELCARALHVASGRKGPLIAVNCAALPAELFESQLFGHVAGAFTGAARAEAGLFREADKGTLFLDEIGELSPAHQAKLLRVLDEGAVVPVGATRAIPVDARVVAATHKDLAADVAAGRFRGDLFARLAEITVHLPPLRERREDILPIAARLLPGKRFSTELVAALLSYAWPFNVRELVKVASELGVKCRGAELLELELVAARLEAPTSAAPAATAAAATGAATTTSFPDRPTREELLALLAAHDGRVQRAARAIGRSRAQIYRWVKELGVDLAAARDDE